MMLASHRSPAPTRRAGPYDALVLPADAGLALLRRRGLRTGPVTYDPVERCIQLLVPQDSAEELPGLLEWLEWSGIALELTARADFTPREAVVWLRPPGPDHEAGHVDLVRLVSAAATECHRAQLRRGFRRRAACAAGTAGARHGSGEVPGPRGLRGSGRAPGSGGVQPLAFS
ncbi:hypothetical protein [Streptomyces sp. HNM0574]|uniref:hypothetical protein n=1 Tax=Streptomyces sp. HNM0574 TaxID=2714954 RepID=UPI00146B7993|nr:hypothetical protein [Streptomyces sp. HNM0574]